MSRNHKSVERSIYNFKSLLNFIVAADIKKKRGNIKKNYTKFLIKPVECIRNINIDGLINFIKKDFN